VNTRLRISDDEVSKADAEAGRVLIEVRLADGDVTEPAASAEAHLVEPQGLSVISDIDDTVKVTEVFRGPSAVLRNTFLREFHPVSGMAELYKAWNKEYGASFQYVSKSPIEFYELLTGFLNASNFPFASLHLCSLWCRDRALFKERQIEEIMSAFPERQFVLVGDSGEKDPEVFAQVIRSHPSQVVKAIVRQVHPEHRSGASAFRGIDPAKWQVFSDPSEVTLPDMPEYRWRQWFKGGLR